MVEPLFEWTDDYLIGVEELDYEHKDMLERLNQLHREIMSGSDAGVIEGCLGSIYTRMGAHFALEEKYMRDTEHWNYGPHKAEHDEFLEDLFDMVELFGNDQDQTFLEALETRLQSWVTRHILTSDKQLH